MFCPKCGAEVSRNDEYCRNCGARTADMPYDAPRHDGDADLGSGSFDYEKYREKHGEFEQASGWLVVLGLVLPIVGFILYAGWYNKHRKRAKYVGVGALIGLFIFLAAITIFYILIQ